MYWAHSVAATHKDSWQPLDRHLQQVGAMAGEFAAAFGAERAAQLAGLLHDLGKYTQAFQIRLEGGKSVDHATAGAREVRALCASGSPHDRLTAELIAYSIAGHHTGLPDMHPRDGSAGGLADRLEKPLEPLDPIWRREITPEAVNLWPYLSLDAKNKAKAAFQVGFLGRMIFSCLIDADRRDTEAFCAKVEGWTADRDWPCLTNILCYLTNRFDAHMKDKQARAADSPVNALRREILAHVRSRSAEKPGLFTLTVPTGGGKTLASLAFALDHAKAHGLERIVYAIPFTSVVDQTAAIFREVLGDEFILEHHSAIEDEKRERLNEDERSARSKLRLAMEDWAAPVVVTTNVQLFESLFAARPSRCRKIHNLARSVIILDEAQTIPLRFLRPCAAALDELARNYGASLVLCTATQPALDARHFKEGDPIGLPLEGRELAPDPRRLAKALTRVRIRLAGEMADDALVHALAEHEQGLVIVNSRGHALSLYRKVGDAGLAGAIHLTTRQYAAHRREILAAIRERLKAGQPCRVVASSLVEAGVDLDFPRVWRAEAGLDQVAQAAGRCNREGHRPLEESIVTVFQAPKNKPPPEIQQLTGDFARMARDHVDDLLSLAALTAYFKEVYWRMGDRLDAKEILREFAVGGGGTSFAYRTVAENFRLIESGMVPVIVARKGVQREEKGLRALGPLASDSVSPGGVARDLQSYIVQVPPKARALLIANGHVAFEREGELGDQFAVLRTDSLYREDIGLLWEDAGYLALENTII